MSASLTSGVPEAFSSFRAQTLLTRLTHTFVLFPRTSEDADDIQDRLTRRIAKLATLARLPVGGLRDTVVDLDDHPTAGTGWAADRPEPVALADAVHRAVRGWSTPATRQAAQARGMAVDWSWQAPARRHVALYEHVAAG